MSEPRNPDAMASATIPVPRDMVHLGVRRIEVFLRPTDKGRYRWFHADGRPTVVDGESVDQAVRVARLVWRDLALLDQPASHSAAN